MQNTCHIPKKLLYFYDFFLCGYILLMDSHCRIQRCCVCLIFEVSLLWPRHVVIAKNVCVWNWITGKSKTYNTYQSHVKQLLEYKSRLEEQRRKANIKNNQALNKITPPTQIPLFSFQMDEMAILLWHWFTGKKNPDTEYKRNIHIRILMQVD